MSQTSLPDPPVPTPDPAPRKRGLFNVKQLRELDEADAVVLAARRPAFAPILLARQISAPMVDDLAQKSAACRAALVDSKAQKGDSQGHTELAHDAREQLIILIQEVQSAARQKLGAKSPLINTSYYGSTDLRQSRAILTQAVEGLLQTLPGAALPGIDAAKIAQIQTELDEYQTALDNQNTGAGGSATDYQAAIALLSEIIAARQTIQFAANGAFPARDKANREHRKDFKIPPDQNFVG